MADHPVRSSHNSGHKPEKRKGLVATIRARNAELARVGRETAPRRAARVATAVNRGRPSDKDIERVKRMSPEAIARELNRQRIRSASKDTARKRSKFAQLAGLRKRSKRGPRSQFIEGKTKF